MSKRIIATSLSILVFSLLSSITCAQTIQGKVVDASEESPLAYVNIGVVNLSRGTITNVRGEYDLNCTDLPADAEVRFSMIGYESQTLPVRDLLSAYRTIRLVKKPLELEEVALQWYGTERCGANT